MKNELTDTDNVARLAEFLGEWRKLRHRAVIDAERLGAFLDAARNSLHVLQPTSQVAAKINPVAFQGQLVELKEALSKARSVGFGFNPWAVARLQRDEVRACAVLAALWNPSMCGDAAVSFLKAFIGQLKGQNLPTGDELKEGYTVRTERYFPGDRSTRMDITIEAKFFIMVIEAKIDAPEGNGSDSSDLVDYKASQFSRIPEMIRTYTIAREPMRGIFVLLSPRKPKIPLDGIYSDWRSLARAARHCLPSKRSAYSLHDRLLADFAQHVAYF